MATPWRGQAAKLLATTAYATLKPLAQFNALTRLAAFLVASVITLDTCPLPNWSEHCDVLVRAFYLLVPQARESVEDTSSSLSAQAFALGVRTYVNDYVTAPHPISKMLDRASHILAEALGATDRIPGQGSKDSLTADTKTLLRRISHQYNQIDVAWHARLSKWRQISLPQYVALSPKDQTKVDYLVTHPDATNFCFDAQIDTHKEILRDDKRKLDQALKACQDMSAVIQMDQTTLQTIETHLSEAQLTCKTQAEKLEDLERQFHAAREMHTQALRRCKEWADAKAPVQERLTCKQAKKNDLDERLEYHASSLFDQDDVLRHEVYRQSLV